MKIFFIGKFTNFYDEEYIARSFEMLGHEVFRMDQRNHPDHIKHYLDEFKPDLVLWTKLGVPQPIITREICRAYKTACWVFDIYWGYKTREHRLTSHPAFTADYVFTTDGGHEQEFKNAGINHHCVRQGIWKDDCVLLPFQPIKHEVIFVGSDNPLFPQRKELVNSIGAEWFGRMNTNEVRGMALNELYASTRIVIGDSYPSPFYWSNRIVETLGRGGFLIHKETEGLTEDYPYLVTYKDEEDLKAKIKYYQEHEEERQSIILKNIAWVRKHYTMEKQCEKLLSFIA